MSGWSFAQNAITRNPCERWAACEKVHSLLVNEQLDTAEHVGESGSSGLPVPQNYKFAAVNALLTRSRSHKCEGPAFFS